MVTYIQNLYEIKSKQYLFKKGNIYSRFINVVNRLSVLLSRYR